MFWFFVLYHFLYLFLLFHSNNHHKATLGRDLHKVKQLLGVESETSYNAAQAIYKSGAYAESAALISMGAPSSVAILAGTEVVGRTSDDREVRGIVRTSISIEEQVLLVEYVRNPDDPDAAGCYVGANTSPEYDGCKGNVFALDLLKIFDDFKENFFLFPRFIATSVTKKKNNTH